MKTILFISLLLLFLCCSKDKEDHSSATGFLSVDVEMDLTLTANESDLKSTPSADDFMVLIYNSSDEEVISFDRAGDIPSQIELKAGNYYAVSYSKNKLPAEFENPYYYGRSENFTITVSSTTTAHIVCKIANCAVSIVFSDQIKTYFSEYSALVSTANGNLVFGKDESRKGYFEILPVSIHATLSYSINNEMRTKTLTGMISSPVAGRHYEIILDAKLNNGISSVNISLDSSEVTEQVYITEDTPLLITEIMFDPDSVADPSGEWFELYNHSTGEINLNGLTIIRGTQKHVITGDIFLSPGGYYALARTDEAFEGEKYIYNTITLSNTGSSIFIYDIEGTDSTLMASITYGPGFPALPGYSISLSPDHLNSTDAKLGSFWCSATTQYNTGDYGTPGLPNDLCE